MFLHRSFTSITFFVDSLRLWTRTASHIGFEIGILCRRLRPWPRARPWPFSMQQHDRWLWPPSVLQVMLPGLWRWTRYESSLCLVRNFARARRVCRRRHPKWRRCAFVAQRFWCCCCHLERRRNGKRCQRGRWIEWKVWGRWSPADLHSFRNWIFQLGELVRRHAGHRSLGFHVVTAFHFGPRRLSMHRQLDSLHLVAVVMVIRWIFLFNLNSSTDGFDFVVRLFFHDYVRRFAFCDAWSQPPARLSRRIQIGGKSGYFAVTLVFDGFQLFWQSLQFWITPIFVRADRIVSFSSDATRSLWKMLGRAWSIRTGPRTTFVLQTTTYKTSGPIHIIRTHQRG